MAFHCITNCSNCEIISRTKYSFLSQQSALSVCERDRESEEVGALSDRKIYLGNGILCIFRQLLKYLCFSYSFLDEGNVMYRLLIPPRKRYTGNDGASR
jgi:hypothetical protein